MEEESSFPQGDISSTHPRVKMRVFSAALISLVMFFSSFSLHAQSSTLIFVPIGPQSENFITLVYPENYQLLGAKVQGWLYEEFKNLTKELGYPEDLKLQIQFSPAAQFYRETGVPKWTNAIYVHSEIHIPIKSHMMDDQEELRRAIRHELVHALIDHGSDGNCPGWIDEGLAQLLEGEEHPALRVALQRWVENEGPISFDLLQTGFTKLKKQMVPAAYAQSFYAVARLKKRTGRDSFLEFMRALKSGVDPKKSFAKAFGVSTNDFQKDIFESLGRFKTAHEYHHRAHSVSHEKASQKLPPLADGVRYEKIRLLSE